MAYTETARQFFQRLSQSLNALSGIGGVIEFDVEGTEGGTWTVDLDKRTVTGKRSDALGKTPSVLVKARERDFMALVEGRMSAQDGLLTERLHVAGDAAKISQLMEALDAMRSA